MLKCLLAVAAFAQAASMPLPPYRRVESIEAFEQGSNPAYQVQGRRLYVAWHGECACYQLPSLTQVWRVKTGLDDAQHSAIGGRYVLISSWDYDHHRTVLGAFDIATGKSLWKTTGTGSGSGSLIAIAGDYAVTGLDSRTASALEISSHRILWTAPLPEPPDRDLRSLGIDYLSIAGHSAIVTANTWAYAFDLKTGKVRWKQGGVNAYAAAPIVWQDDVLLPVAAGSVLRRAFDGKVLWKSEAAVWDQAEVVPGGQLLGIGGGYAGSVRLASGVLLWKHQVGPANVTGGNQWAFSDGKLVLVRGLTRTALFNLSGKELWSAPADASIDQPVWSDSGHIVSFASGRLSLYVHGEAEMPSSPSGKTEEVRQMLARYGQLDDQDFARIASYGDDAFAPLLDAFVANIPAAEENLSPNASSMSAYSEQDKLAHLMDKTGSKRDSAALIAAAQKTPPNSLARGYVFALLTKFGDPKQCVPVFIDQVRTSPDIEHQEVSPTNLALEFLGQSSDPRAVDYLLQQLKDPKAKPYVREEAYDTLAGSGDPRAIAAVLAERHTRQTLVPLQQRVLASLGHGTSKVLSEKTDRSARVWDLFTSPELGSSGDLWIGQRVNGKLKRLAFTGVSTRGISKWAGAGHPEPTVAGKTAAQLVNRDWINVLPHDADLWRDTDGDGLTDIEEHRLGTDPRKRDTDGDGDLDGIDAWPNAGRQAETDDEKVLAAVFEARFHFEHRTGAALLFAPSGMKPFEMVGRTGPTMWAPSGHHDWTLPLEQCYEQGVAFIRFAPDIDEHAKTAPPWLLKWNPGHTEASVIITNYYGGLAGDGFRAVVRKVGKDWLVVSMRMASIS